MRYQQILVLTCLLLSSLSASLANASPRQVQGEPLDQIAAVVNDDVITKSELARTVTLTEMELTQSHQSIPDTSTLRKQTLDKLINKKLQLQLAKQGGITTDSKELDRAIKRVADQNQMSVPSLLARIEQDGMTQTEYKNEIRNQITLQKLQQQEIVSRISVTDDDMKSFLRSKKWVTEGPKEYHVEDFLVPLAEGASDTEKQAAKKTADQLVVALHHHLPISQIAAPIETNDLGWRKIEEMPEIFTAVIAHMQGQDISAPVAAGNGMHVLHLIESRALAVKQPAPTHQQLQQLLMQRKFEQAMQIWVSKLRGQAFIVIPENMKT
ncbi:MAG TPA: SurA N-terminal domain-containing protein [Gammaproteobacteria bacterium]|jgi:peptidyl-prolyl cis-trans isomerase SurA|nr:SurA N-terminal domain-containing protein [Gammaproteobacteria bacterium]